MRGKIAFVLGAAVGYVLGSRAGRERYEQIKRGARTLWNTEPVQQGVGAVQGVVGDGLHTLKNAAVQSGKDVLSTLVQQNQSSSGDRSGGNSGTASSHSTSSGSSGAASKSSAAKSTAKSSGSGSSRSSSKTQKTQKTQAGDADS